MNYFLKIKKVKSKLKISEEFELNPDTPELILLNEKSKNILLYEASDTNTSDLDVIKLLSCFDFHKWKIRLTGSKKIVKGFEELLSESGYKVEIDSKN